MGSILTNTSDQITRASPLHSFIFTQAIHFSGGLTSLVCNSAEDITFDSFQIRLVLSSPSSSQRKQESSLGVARMAMIWAFSVPLGRAIRMTPPSQSRSVI